MSGPARFLLHVLVLKMVAGNGRVNTAFNTNRGLCFPSDPYWTRGKLGARFLQSTNAQSWQLDYIILGPRGRSQKLSASITSNEAWEFGRRSDLIYAEDTMSLSRYTFLPQLQGLRSLYYLPLRLQLCVCPYSTLWHTLLSPFVMKSQSVDSTA